MAGKISGDPTLDHTTIVAADYFPAVQAAGPTNKRITLAELQATPLQSDLVGNTKKATGLSRVESVHFSAASGGAVSLSNNNANVSGPSISGDDVSGVVTINYSGAIAVDVQLTKVNFGTAYATAPRVLVQKAGVGTGGGVGVWYYVDAADISTTGFFIRNGIAVSGSGAGKCAYMVIAPAGG